MCVAKGDSASCESVEVGGLGLVVAVSANPVVPVVDGNEQYIGFFNSIEFFGSTS